MLLRVCIVSLALAALTTLSAASPTYYWEQVDNSAGLVGYTTVDLFVESPDAGVCCAALLFELQQGDIFYWSVGDPALGTLIEAEKNQPPPQSIEEIAEQYPEFAAWPYTTYVTINQGPVGFAGGAGDVGGDALLFSDTEIDVSWFSFAYPVGSVHMARLTFSNDSVGTWGFYTVGNASGYIEAYGTVESLIPEPASLTLLTLAGLMVCAAGRFR